jgi:NADH-quinone oxidoreductase subunit J
MLLNAPHEETDQDERLHAFRRQGPFRFGVVLAIALATELTWALTKGGATETGGFPGAAVSSVQAIGKVLFTEYAFPFEVTSVLILVAMVGAVVLAKRDA